MSQTPPITQVGAIATVRGVIRSSIFWGSMCIDSSTSQKMGTPLAATTAAAVAKKPMAGTITSVPGPTPAATNAACSAPVPELVPRAYGTPKVSRATFPRHRTWRPAAARSCTAQVGPFPQVVVGDDLADPFQDLRRKTESLGNGQEFLHPDLRRPPAAHRGKGLRSAIYSQITGSFMKIRCGHSLVLLRGLAAKSVQCNPFYSLFRHVVKAMAGIYVPLPKTSTNAGIHRCYT